MEMIDDNNKDIVELEEESVILRIPKNTVFLKIEASVVDYEGVLRRYRISMPLEDIKNARTYFEENVGDEDYDAKWILTEEGRRYLEQLEEMKN